MAKDGKTKVPKRIAGVKVPKKVRRTANKALKFADHPVAMELAAAALTAAAAALRTKKNGGPKATAAAVERGFETAREQAGQLRDVIIAAALDGARRLMDAGEASVPEPAEEPKAAAAAPKPAPKPKPKPKRANAGRAPAPAARDA
jgi:hypothetical protein